jgi:hypothetical protein
MSQTKVGDIFKEIGGKVGFVGEKVADNLKLYVGTYLWCCGTVLANYVIASVARQSHALQGESARFAIASSFLLAMTKVKTLSFGEDSVRLLQKQKGSTQTVSPQMH